MLNFIFFKRPLQILAILVIISANLYGTETESLPSISLQEASIEPKNLFRAQEDYKVTINLHELSYLQEKIYSYYRNPKGYENSVKQLVMQAQQACLEYIKNKTPEQKAKLAFIIDIDDTALSNLAQWVPPLTHAQKNLDRGASQFLPHNPAVLALVNFARSQGCTIIFITGRPGNDKNKRWTEENLTHAGYSWDQIFYRPTNYEGPAAIFKAACRQNIEKQNYTIILNIGDQFTDLSGPHQALINVKLPNFLYHIE